MVRRMGREGVAVDRWRAAKERPIVPAPMRVMLRGVRTSMGGRDSVWTNVDCERTCCRGLCN